MVCHTRDEQQPRWVNCQAIRPKQKQQHKRISLKYGFLQPYIVSSREGVPVTDRHWKSSNIAKYLSYKMHVKKALLY